MPTNKKKVQIVYAFIDSQNLNLGILSQGWQLDFHRFRVYLRDKYRVKKAFLFIGYIPKNRKLYSFLEEIGYSLIYKPVIEPKRIGRKIKGNVDAELVLHAMIQFSKYDKAIIVTGDGDFHCLVEYLSQKKKLGRLLVPNKARYSQLLSKFRDASDYLSNLKNKLKWEVSQSRTKP